MGSEARRALLGRSSSWTEGVRVGRCRFAGPAIVICSRRALWPEALRVALLVWVVTGWGVCVGTGAFPGRAAVTVIRCQGVGFVQVGSGAGIVVCSRGVEFTRVGDGQALVVGRQSVEFAGGRWQ